MTAVSPALAAESTPRPTFEADEVMVQLRDGSWEARTVGDDTPFGVLALVEHSEIVAVEPMRLYSQLAPSNPPSDPAFPNQWHLRRNQAPRSWQYGDGSGVTVAVIDSGVDPVSDLGCHTYVSPYDFRSNQATVPPDSNGHGTFVTGVLAECTDNGNAAAGTAPGATIMPLGVIFSDGMTSTEEVYQALNWALDHGSEVVNLSLGFACTDPYPQCRDVALDSAISTLADAGVMMVAAAGNEGTGFLAYPANHPEVIAAGASGFDGQRASYSSFGLGHDLVAPTGDSDDPAGKDGVIQQGSSGLEIGNGTSYSAPQVSAGIAILMSAGAHTADAAATAILQSASDISPGGYDTATGFGDLRIRDALAWGGLGLTPPIEDAQRFEHGDLNGDDRDDAVVYDGRYGRWWALISEGGELAADEWTRFSTVSGWTATLTGDFSGDDRHDVANFHPSNGTWWVSRSTGTGFVNDIWADFSTETGWGPRLVGDFNGDGRADIANYHSANGTWWVSRSTGSGFSTSLWADFSTSTGWKTHVVGDFNGDGRDDIASYHPANGTWWVSRSTGSGFATSLWADYSTASGWSSQIAGDFNGDGRDDIANFHPANGTWWISRSTGSGFATGLWADYTTASGWGPQLAGDFNGDGRDDIANYHSSNGTWWVSRSTGSALSTSLWADYSTTSGWTSQQVADTDGDGRDDIVNHHENGVWAVSSSTGSGFATSTWFD